MPSIQPPLDPTRMQGHKRVVSLLPSATEMVCAVGARDQLVGVSHECDFPPGVETLPVLTRPRQELPRPSGEIDKAVRQIVADALSVYEVDVDALRSLNPDVIVTQDLCEVCAVSLDDVEKALQEICGDEGSNVTIVSLGATDLEGVWADLRRVGVALDRTEDAQIAAGELEARCQAIGARSAKVGSRPYVLTIEWLDPVMIGGTWMPELVELAGGQALVTVPGEHAPTLPMADLEALDPDVVLIKPCGFDLARTEEEADLLTQNLPWDQWSAMREGRVFAADGSAFFNRPGPRLVESLEILAACVHPELFEDFAERQAANFRRVTADLRFES